MYHVYILRSQRNASFYTGFTKDIDTRLSQHNMGRVKATRHIRPLEIVYSEPFESETEARRREYYIKSQKSRKFIERLVAAGG